MEEEGRQDNHQLMHVARYSQDSQAYSSEQQLPEGESEGGSQRHGTPQDKTHYNGQLAVELH